MAEIKVISTNRKAYHNYLVQDSLEAGIVLTGTEIKSIRDGRVNLGEAYVRAERGELWLFNAHIGRYDAGSYMSHEPMRMRKLLLHRKQINNLAAQASEKGLTVVPLKLYLKEGRAKLDIALAKGKKMYDKRETLLKQEAEREMGRATKKRLEARS